MKARPTRPIRGQEVGFAFAANCLLLRCMWGAVALFVAGAAYAGVVWKEEQAVLSVQVRILGQEIHFGEPFTLEIEVLASAGLRVPEALTPAWPNLELELLRASEESKGGGTLRRETYRARAYALEKIQLAPLDLQVLTAEGARMVRAQSQALELTVRSSLSAEDSLTLELPSGPLRERARNPVLLLLFCSIPCLSLAGFFVLRRNARAGRMLAQVPVPTPPRIAPQARLLALEERAGVAELDQAAWHAALAGIMAEVVTGESESSTTRTSQELYDLCQAGSSAQAGLGALLASCDGVRYASRPSSPSARAALVAQARLLLESLAPQPPSARVQEPG